MVKRKLKHKPMTTQENHFNRIVDIIINKENYYYHLSVIDIIIENFRILFCPKIKNKKYHQLINFRVRMISRIQKNANNLNSK